MTDPSPTPAPSVATFAVVRAAAGCGKTTDLARRYLALVAEGVEVERIIAITFTRKAAAELRERVSAALRGCLAGRDHAVAHPASEAEIRSAERARGRLGSAWPLYAEVAPKDPAVVRAALAGLPDAPIGTTDGFIQALLTEFALDVALPLPNGDRVALDVPIRAAGGPGPALERAARRLLDPADGSVDPDVSRLSRHFGLDELLHEVAGRSSYDHLPAASHLEVTRAVAEAAAALLRGHDLAAAYGVRSPEDPEDWRSSLARHTNDAGRSSVAAVAAWLHAGRPQPAPVELVGWLGGLNAQGHARKQLLQALKGASLDLGIDTPSLWEVIQAIGGADAGPVHALREARERLKSRVLSLGLRSAAEAGQLAHDDLSAAAIALCEAPPARLAGRFRALLVDEVQDANATQLRLYRALAALPGPEPVRAYFVGDSRQSIYLFRHAEPSGFQELEEEAVRRGGQVVPLATNHRSAPELVHAQIDLFQALAGPLSARGLRPLESLEELLPDPRNASLAPADGAPVRLVVTDAGPLSARDVDQRALWSFWDQLRRVWDEQPDSAAVLCPTWSRAQECCELLRRWAGRDDVAFVEGGATAAQGRAATDLQLLLAALLDPSDDVAWLGVWKHPSVGLTDAALARVRAGVGLEVQDGSGRSSAWVPAPAHARALGALVEVDRLAAPHDEVDRRAFARAVGPLRAAREALGREETARTLDAVVTALAWRVVYAAGPGGRDDVAALEVLLDHVRSLAADGADPHAILAALADPDAIEAPQVHLDRPERHVACTTVFQAKGRAWDHVMVVSPGRPSGGGPRADRPPATTWVRLPGGSPTRLEAMSVDLAGGLESAEDPLSRLARLLEARRVDEECVRLAYVALTRARRTVTLGLPSLERGAKPVQWLIAGVWADPELAARGVQRVAAPPPPEPPSLPTGWARPRPGSTLLLPEAPARSWIERAPSSASVELAPERRADQARWIATRVALSGGFHPGGSAVHPADEGRMSPTAWGELVHGWFACWRFQGAPAPEAVDAYLAAEAPPALSVAGASSEVRDWLVALSASLVSRGGPLWALVTAPDSKLHFELPFVGVGRTEGRDALWAGRMDLLVERKRSVTVVDFKAGRKAPTSILDLVDGASLRTYGPQLEAYRGALESMDRQVDAVALWFVRSGAAVRW